MEQKDYREIFRYLGYGKNKGDEATLKLIDVCQKELESQCAPKYIYKIYDLKTENEELFFAGMRVKSQSLFKNLKGCKKVALMAVTLGSAADFLIKKNSLVSMPKAVVMQAVCAWFAERVCDEAEGKIKEETKLFLRPRFSPGYGDFKIDYQKDFIKVLDAPKKIGLTLTDSLMLVPSKSVTALMGLDEKENNCISQGCESCSKTDCAFRR